MSTPCSTAGEKRPQRRKRWSRCHRGWSGWGQERRVFSPQRRWPEGGGGSPCGKRPEPSAALPGAAGGRGVHEPASVPQRPPAPALTKCSSAQIRPCTSSGLLSSHRGNFRSFFKASPGYSSAFDMFTKFKCPMTHF